MQQKKRPTRNLSDGTVRGKSERTTREKGIGFEKESRLRGRRGNFSNWEDRKEGPAQTMNILRGGEQKGQFSPGSTGSFQTKVPLLTFEGETYTCGDRGGGSNGERKCKRVIPSKGGDIFKKGGAFWVGWGVKGKPLQWKGKKLRRIHCQRRAEKNNTVKTSGRRKTGPQ